MKKLIEMSEHEINCLIATELGFKIKERWLNTGIIILNLLHNGNTVVRPVDYCKNSSDYMPIAIEHCIDIDFYDDDVQCSSCTHLNIYRTGRFMPKSDTGRAVCERFLMTRGHDE